MKFRALVVTPDSVGLAGVGNDFILFRPRVHTTTKRVFTSNEDVQARRVERAGMKIARKRRRNQFNVIRELAGKLGARKKLNPRGTLFKQAWSPA